MNSAGLSVPSLVTIAQYHPQFALAIAKGVRVRPNLRPLSVEIQNSQLGQPVRASFQEIISQYSVFAGIKVTIDPTNNLTGNPLKYLSDAAQPLTSQITLTLLVKSNDGTDYAPVPDDTPLQGLQDAFAPSIGIWAMVNPENVKARFVLQSVAEGDNFTVWVIFTFLVLAADGSIYLSMTPDAARAELVKMGILPAAA
jgi:hypothetical protein